MKEQEIIFRIGKPDPCWAMDSDVYIQLLPPPELTKRPFPLL